MSYSFTVRGAIKSAVLELVEVELDKVVSQQSVHNKDRDTAVGTAKTLIDMLDVDETKDVLVQMNGSITWDPEHVRSVSLSVGASLVEKLPPKAA